MDRRCSREVEARAIAEPEAVFPTSDLLAAVTSPLCEIRYTPIEGAQADLIGTGLGSAPTFGTGGFHVGATRRLGPLGVLGNLAKGAVLDLALTHEADKSVHINSSVATIEAIHSQRCGCWQRM